ncbi:PREDICTED: piggyBac transposable element-derived protein 3-like [Priapulus caudatus]|uniref:PiggyBac transposable element-derived protein 3-like n=1 Tax=Priapulus caudatus TaxID=37621 RepID=A0ABM1ESD1_PRICU|nr:PREDICTED: piggyBac transposable element-derived protein 3-like [Priapulus caudatus]
MNATMQEIEQFMGIYFKMGLVKMPGYACFWETDLRYNPVADIMSRNRFQKLTSYLHIKNNNTVTEQEKEDRAWKVRPWLDSLNATFSQVSPDEHQSIDEIMVAFKGRALLKQYMPKKPKKWGFKLWGRCDSSGFLHQFDVYQGRGSGLVGDAPNCGLGGNVVLMLCQSLPEKRNFKICADNFFSNFAMIYELKKRDMFYIGTVRKDRLHGAPLKTEDLKKIGRGAHHSVIETTRNLFLLRWYDNKCVNMVSSYVCATPVAPVRRYDRKKKEHINVEQPCIVRTYNSTMGGVDLLDMMCSLYKCHLKTRRWYFFIFYHTLTIALVNSWFLYKRDCKLMNVKNIMCLRKFQAQVSSALCQCEKRVRGRPSLGTPPPLKKNRVNPRPIADVQYDHIDHLPLYVDERQRCKCCSEKFSQVKCQKCGVHLCLNKNRNCFIAFHQK